MLIAPLIRLQSLLPRCARQMPGGVMAVAAAAVAWFALVVLAPVLPPALAAAVYAAGGFVCHQLPDRSFHWHGAQLAVCARCTGIYLGACTSVLFAVLPPSTFSGWVASRTRVAWLLGAAAAPMIATVGAEWVGWWQPSAIVRAFTGVIVGAAGACVVLAALRYGEWQPRAADAQRRPPARPPQTPI
jgi:uncharacterized membrane protein